MRKNTKCMVKVHIVRVPKNQPIGNTVVSIMRQAHRKALRQALDATRNRSVLDIVIDFLVLPVINFVLRAFGR